MSIKPPHVPPAGATTSESTDDDVPSERLQAAPADVDVLLDRLSEPPMPPDQPGYVAWLAATAADALCADPSRFWEVAIALLHPEHAQVTPARLHHVCAAIAGYAAGAINDVVRANKRAFVPQPAANLGAWVQDMPTWYTDDYDNSIEVFHADLVSDRAASLAAALHALGFTHVWVHPHAGDRTACATTNCGGPSL